MGPQICHQNCLHFRRHGKLWSLLESQPGRVAESLSIWLWRFIEMVSQFLEILLRATSPPAKCVYCRRVSSGNRKQMWDKHEPCVLLPHFRGVKVFMPPTLRSLAVHASLNWQVMVVYMCVFGAQSGGMTFDAEREKKWLGAGHSSVQFGLWSPASWPGFVNTFVTNNMDCDTESLFHGREVYTVWGPGQISAAAPFLAFWLARISWAFPLFPNSTSTSQKDPWTSKVFQGQVFLIPGTEH